MVANEWQKSSKCGSAPDCVEVRYPADTAMVEVRNSKRLDAGTVVFTAGEWEAFIGGAKLGEFDLYQ